MEKKLLVPHQTLRGRHHNLRKAVYAAMIFLSFHFYFVIYINSTYISRFAPAQFVNVLYMLGASLSLLLFFLMPAILRTYGSFKVITFLILLEMLATVGLAGSQSLFALTIFFIIHQALPSLLLFSLDMFLERCTARSEMGKVRGIYFTISSLIVVVAPTVVGFILHKSNFQTIYLLSFLFLVPLFFIAVKEFKHVDEPQKHELHAKQTVRELFKRREVGIVFITDFLLQFFYAIMVIYMPLYLSRTIGMNWRDIGITFTIMLLPFLLFEIPLGTIADRRLGEKEILISGFLIAGASTFIIPYLSTSYFLSWAILLFVTRIGASFIEIANETYFFKRVRPEDTNLISLYRAAIPLSYIIAPFAAGVVLICFPQSALFTMLGCIMVIGFLFATRLHDTK